MVESTEPAKPVYHWILHAWDEQVQAAIKIQMAFRRLRKQSKDVGWPSAENPYHWIHFVDIRKRIGWTKEELYDDFGVARVRTDGGRAHLKKLAPADAKPNHILDPIGNFKQRYHREPIGAEVLDFNVKVQQISVSDVGRYLADRWWKARQDALKQKLLKQPMRGIFKHGTQQYERLMAWMLDNGHGTPLDLKNPQLQDLRASISHKREEQQKKIMNLLGMFHNVLQFKQGDKGKRMEVNREAVSMYDWAIRDTGKEYADELEEANRWCSTPPEPPDGFEQDLYDLHQKVCQAVAASTNRYCRLRKTGRRWLQAFEDSTYRRRRLIRTRSVGNLGLLGPPTIDPATTKVILPLVGEPLEKVGPNGPLRHWVHVSLQKTVARQKRRQEAGRERPLRCINTEWMAGVDWRVIEAIATDQPMPTEPYTPPAPTDEELGDLFEGMLDSNKLAPEAGAMPEEEIGGEEHGYEDAADKKRMKKDQEQLEHASIPFETLRYVGEVHDVLEESGLTGQHCEGVLRRLMRALRAPRLLPPFDTKALAWGVNLWLRAQPKPERAKHQIPVHNEHAAVGSEGQDQAVHQIKLEQGECIPTRSLSSMLPNEIGQAIERAYQHPKLPTLPKAPTLSPSAPAASLGQRGSSRVAVAAAAGTTAPEQDVHTDSEDEVGQADVHAAMDEKPEITWPMMQRAWQQGGLPGWQGCDARTLYRVLDCHDLLCGGEDSSAFEDSCSSISLSHRQLGTSASLSCTLASMPSSASVTGCMASAVGHSLLARQHSASILASGAAKACAAEAGSAHTQHGGGAWPSHEIACSLRTSSPGNELAAGTRRSTSRSPSLQPRSLASAVSSPNLGLPRPASPPPPSAEASHASLYSSADVPSAMAYARALAQERKRQALAHAKEEEARWRKDAGLRFDNKDWSKSAYYVFFQHAKEKEDEVAAGNLALIERVQGAAKADVQHTGAEDAQGLAAGPSFAALAQAYQVQGAPTSDMLLLRRKEFWAVVIADAHVVQAYALPVRLKRSHLHPSGQGMVRQRRRLEEQVLINAYLEHYIETQKKVGKKSVSVGPMAISAITPTAHKHMQLDWCTLFKSEMYKWLNRYLTMGKLPGNARAPTVTSAKADVLEAMSRVLPASKDRGARGPRLMPSGNGGSSSALSDSALALGGGHDGGSHSQRLTHLKQSQSFGQEQQQPAPPRPSTPRGSGDSGGGAQLGPQCPSPPTGVAPEPVGRMRRLSRSFSMSQALSPALSTIQRHLSFSRLRASTGSAALSGAAAATAATATLADGDAQALEQEGCRSMPANVQPQRLVGNGGGGGSGRRSPHPPTEPLTRGRTLFVRPQATSRSHSINSVREQPSSSSHAASCAGSASGLDRHAGLEGYLESDSVSLGRQAAPMPPQLQNFLGQQQQQQRGMHAHPPPFPSQEASTEALSRQSSFLSPAHSFSHASPLPSPLARASSRQLVPTRVSSDALLAPRLVSGSRHASPMPTRLPLEASSSMRTLSGSQLPIDLPSSWLEDEEPSGRSSSTPRIHSASLSNIPLVRQPGQLAGINHSFSSRSESSRPGTAMTRMAMLEGRRGSFSGSRFGNNGCGGAAASDLGIKGSAAGTMRGTDSGSTSHEGALSSMDLGLSVAGRGPSKASSYTSKARQ